MIEPRIPLFQLGRVNPEEDQMRYRKLARFVIVCCIGVLIGTSSIAAYTDQCYAGEKKATVKVSVYVDYEKSYEALKLINKEREKRNKKALTRREQEIPPTSISGGMNCGLHGVLFTFT